MEVKTFLQSLFGEEHSNNNYDDEIREKKRNWVYEQENKQKPSADWHYSQYLKRFYDDVVAKGKDEPYLPYKEFDEVKQVFIQKALAEREEEQIRKINHSRIKLTNAEKYLIDAAKLNQGCYVVADEYKDGCLNKSPAELRQAIKRMRARTDYKVLKDLDLALQKVSGLGELYDLFYGDGTSFSQKLIWKSQSDLGEFAMAENRIVGLSEEEIRKLAILEAL